MVLRQQPALYYTGNFSKSQVIFTSLLCNVSHQFDIKASSHSLGIRKDTYRFFSALVSLPYKPFRTPSKFSIRYVTCTLNQNLFHKAQLHFWSHTRQFTFLFGHSKQNKPNQHVLSMIRPMQDWILVNNLYHATLTWNPIYKVPTWILIIFKALLQISRICQIYIYIYIYMYVYCVN